MQQALLLFALSVAPGIAISLFIFLRDRYNREPRSLLVRSFLLGLVSAGIAMVLQLILLPQVQSMMGDHIGSVAVKAFFVVALTEEWSKYIMVRYYAWRKPAFDEPLDGIVYTVMVGMGFATIENVGYVMQHGIGTAFLRMFLSVPAHACFAVLMGYQLGLAKFHESRKWVYLFRGLALAVLFHGLFDFFLFLQENTRVTDHVSTLVLFLGALASFIIALNLSNRAIRSHTELSRKMHGGEGV
jgi:RsiW-degrading membrane proteinase PrsW (M82 family)